MKLITVIILLFSLSSSVIAQDTSVYDLLNTGTLQTINQKIKKLEPSIQKSNLYKCYYGSLISKKSEKIKSPKEKISNFKIGVSFIEESIESNPKNSELRFLRYLIQVKSPKIVSYKINIAEDKAFIEKSKITSKLKVLINNFNLQNTTAQISI
jgi:hypothetical protein